MNNIFLGKTPLHTSNDPIIGEFVHMQDERFYKIKNVHLMPDFFMTIVSHSDLWMYISSNGSLSAGRKNRNNALFPYYTDDKIHDYCGITGSKTFVLVEQDGCDYLWEPFSKEMSSIYKIERNLYKSEYGDKLIFEEINLDLNVAFQYGWYTSEKFGFVKQSKVTSLGDQKLKIKILDGIKNILPNGVYYEFQNEFSNLLDGYKKNELIKQTGLGLFMLSSIPVDRAEPSESLNATTVWSCGLSGANILLSNHQIENFKKGLVLQTEYDIRASRGAFFLNTELELSDKESREWMLVAEVNQSTNDVANLNHFLSSKQDFAEIVKNDIRNGTDKLVRIVATADGLQTSNEDLCTARHFSNTLFNVMRGGIYIKNYTVELSDFKGFIEQTNRNIALQYAKLLDELPNEISKFELLKIAEKTGHADFIRICNEYLPLTFSRRHGDPSRPWNQFSIENRNDDGTPKSDFQGNWRDIFQNWEALSLSYPGYIEDIISKFVNATTVDGYNPYRIMRSGIDWECPDPDDPWAYIGYWGDHQIIYLQKLLELSVEYHPGKLDELLTKEIFAFANVPYRIKSYADMIENAKDTIEFDFEKNENIKQLVKQIGADGNLVMNREQSVHHVNLTEKILVTMLAKLSNFIPEAGIWLNTQRPEWNDANNALVGNGVSMVTLYYLRRFLHFWNKQFNESSKSAFPVSEEIATLFHRIEEVFKTHTTILESGFSDEQRRSFADQLGAAGTTYRNTLYQNSFSGARNNIEAIELVNFTQLALDYIDQSIKVNKRENGLYHAYNLISFTEKGITIRYLYEMLEGQVAVLSAGSLSAEESLDVLNCLKWSSLFRSDQYSYILYPDRQLPRFEEKNNIPGKSVKESKLLSQLVNDKETSILSVDQSGHFHFNGKFRNANFLDLALDELDEAKYGPLVKQEKTMILEIYEEMFDHQSFTGRSGTFYAYEGLGSIYWHMVSKLLLAVEECFFKATDEGADPVVIGKIKDHYFEIKAGLGLYKSPELYGAFPTDAYSHTPGNGGAKQPGMTGQVKEDFISRMGELGIRISQGEIHFDTHLINPKEFLEQAKAFEYLPVNAGKKRLMLNENQLGLTLCQVPIIYSISDHDGVHVHFSSGREQKIAGNFIDSQISSSVFSRDGQVERIEVFLKQIKK